LFEETRYTWSQQISLVRLFVTNRSGTFGNPEQSMRQNLENRDIYIEILRSNLDQLLDFDKKGMLGFQQSESVRIMYKIHNEYEVHFKQAYQVYLS